MTKKRAIHMKQISFTIQPMIMLLKEGRKAIFKRKSNRFKNKKNRRYGKISTTVFSFGTPSGTRTLDTLIKSQVLWPTELKEHEYGRGRRT